MPAVSSVAVIGLGSRGLGVLERILTLAGPGTELRIEVIDPDPTGAGVHARNQPDYLLLNTICAQVTMFADEHTVGAGTGRPGPTLYEWACEHGLRVADDGYSVGPTGRALRPTDFLPRRLLGDYLAWVFDLLRSDLPAGVDVRVHRAEADQLTSLPDGQLRITLSDGSALTVDRAFLTTGYTGNRPGRLAHPRLIEQPYPMPDRLAAIQPGQQVALGGFGLSAMDTMSSLTLGRGGRYVSVDGRLRYLASGDEPRLLFFSRSGLPCRARPKVLQYGPTYRPLLFTRDGIDGLRARRGGSLDFETDLWPLVLAEVTVSFRRWQARAAGTEAVLLARLTDAVLAGRLDQALAELDDEFGRFDPRGLLDPSGQLCLADSTGYQDWVLGYISDDLAEGLLGLTTSSVKACLDVLRELRDIFRYAIDFGGLSPVSLASFLRQWVPTINRAVVGPQYERHLELIALVEAGVASIPLGPAPTVSWDFDGQHWLLRSSALGEAVEVAADWLVQARHDLPSVAESVSPLLDSLYRAGLIRPRQPGSTDVVGIDIDRDQHPINAAGEADQRIWVLGPLCEGATFYNNLVPSPGTFSRPIHDAHRCVSELLHAGRQALVAAG